ncbi:hypothetical protein RSOLAG1IB_00631 [Rhizoctonia solani AG-1 IB]|uniref:Uncharacterized protein n=1 Tax=Thanatephorus cucumeris (strain AG1-IB / isolate 7/3/14) TaxID=1108050 RepID=A0A0B7F5B9_THACB|nr:hypothetical protein RSOLAG1IB_00631 [Rhizoctonia solani AG-1 IB]
MTATDGPESGPPPAVGSSTLTRVPTIRRKSSASTLLSFNKGTGSPASPPPVRDNAPAVPETWDSQSMFSDASGGTGVAGTIASTTGHSPNTGSATPTTATSGPGTSVEALQHVVQRRLQVLTMLKSSHEGGDFWFNTILLTREDLAKHLSNAKMRNRTYRFTLLCMSLSALFEVQNTQITNPPTASDFLRSLLGTLSEFDQFVGSGAEKAGLGMMMGLVDTEARGKMRNLFRANKAVRRPGTAGNSELAANDSSSDHSYLLFPSLPFLLDYFQVLPTFCDILIALYHRLAHLLGTNPSTTATAPFAFLPHPSPPPDASAGAMYSNAPGICGTIGGLPGSDLWSLLNVGLGRDPGMAGAGAGLGQMVGSAGNQGDTIQWTPSLLEMVVKIDAKVKKILSILLKELDAIARDSIRDELASLDPLALLRNATSPTSVATKFEFAITAQNKQSCDTLILAPPLKIGSKLHERRPPHW